MRKPSTYSLRNEEEGSDSYSTSAAASTQAYLDDNASPQNSYNKGSDDSDCFSDSSRKIRKKRNAYQKISDEIRLELLACVKNGETLKSAAKRFKINYSSAKSILHTFRKEGRILKKSAQERTMKKKPESMTEVEQGARGGRFAKKGSFQFSTEGDNSSRSMGNLAARGFNSKESTPVGSLSRLDEGAYDQQNYYHGYKLEEERANHDEIYAQKHRNMTYQDDGHHYNKMNYYMNYNDGMVHQPQQQQQQPQHHDTGRNYMLPEGLEHHNQYTMPSYGRDFDSFNDMVTALNHRPNQVDEFFTDNSAAYVQPRELIAQPPLEDKYFKTEHGTEYHGHEEAGGYNTLKSFMDTQSIFRDALKKANHVSFSNSNNSGYRKSSIDLF